MKKFLGKIAAFFSSKIKDLDRWIEDHVQPAVEIVMRIKSFVDDKTLDFVAALTNTDLDEKALAWVRNVLPKAIDALGLTAGISNEPDTFKKIKLFLTWMRSKSAEQQKGMYLRLGSNAARISGRKSEKVDGHIIDLAVQSRVTELLSKVNADNLINEDAGEKTKQVFYNPFTMKYE